MRRADRLFEIIEILRRTDGTATADQIAEQTEVSVRTIYRDIASLQAGRVPIDGEAGVGYTLRPSYDLPPLMFNDEEAEANGAATNTSNGTDATQIKKKPALVGSIQTD